MKTCSQCGYWYAMDQEEEFPDIGFCTVSLPMIIENQSKLDNTTHGEDNAQDCDCFQNKDEMSLMKHDGGEDFTLNGEACWITVKGFAVHIHTTDEGVVVDIFDDYNVDAGVLSSCYAFDSELQGCGDDVPDDESCRDEDGGCGSCEKCPGNAPREERIKEADDVE